MTIPNQPHQRGFTIVELLIVIVVIAILASITIVSYSGIVQRAGSSVAASDLKNAATIMDIKYADASAYPTAMPTEVKTSPNIILQLTKTGDSDEVCINAYSTKDTSLRMSWDSLRGGLQSTMLCDGVPIGSSVGGIVPAAPRSINLTADFSRWTLSGGATYVKTTKILTLTSAGIARSPIVRVDSPRFFAIGGDFYATTASTSSVFTPQAGYHTNISYFGSDGVTPALNSGNFTANGCAQPFAVNTWSNNDRRCVYNGGPNVIYSSFSFSGSNAGYASPDLKIKTPLMIVTD